MLLLTNHIGYERLGPKKAIIQTEQPHLSSYTAQLICATSEQTVATFAVEEQGKVANWHHGYFYLIDFSSFTDSGDYFLHVEDS
ncbi:hypothetical protein OFC56_34245, partial [Escherichia coli]|nr:hypothetical protein [Escherichia coli]